MLKKVEKKKLVFIRILLLQNALQRSVNLLSILT